MGFFSKFRKWMGAEEPTEKVEQSAAPVEKQPDDAEAARDVVAQPSESAGAVDAADAAEAAKDAASEASVSEEDAPASSEPAPEAVAAAPAAEEDASAAPASSDVAEPEAAEVVQAENVAEADVAAPAQPEEPVAEAADTAKDAASEAPVSEEDASAASEPAPEAVAAAPVVEEAPAASVSPDVAESEAAEAVQAENVAEADVAAPAQPEEPVAETADTAKDAAAEAPVSEEDAPAASESAPEAVAAAPAAEEALAAPASSDVAEPEAAEVVQAENVAEADVAAPAQPEEPVAEAVDTAQDAPSEASLLEEDAPAASEPAPEAVAAAPAAEEDASASPDVAEPETAEAPQAETVAAPVSPAPEVKPRKKKGWFASLFGGSDDEEEEKPAPAATAAPAADFDDAAMTLRLREADPSLSAWLAIVLDGVDEVDAFVDEFARWLERMEYHYIDEFRSELQYRLALALDMEDEEDERNRLFLKISDGLARTREQFSRQLNAIFSGHGELTEEFWENLEELFIMADLGYDASLALVERLRKRAADMGVVKTEGMRAVLRDEIEEIFRVPRKITAFNPPEVILFIGVNGVGKTTTIAKLAYRARMQGKKVMIAAADTFRAAAIEQLQVWAERVGALFHARAAGSDPASVAFEAMDRALAEQVDILFVDTAGRLQTKHNLMEELTKIRTVLGKKHPGAPHRTILALDATTGQNALSQAKLFKEAAGVDELILTKLDGTAKGGVAIAVAMQEHLPITYIGLGEKLEDLRPFNGDDYARALLGEGEIVGTGK